MISVKLFRILTGEEIITEVISEDDKFVTVKNGLVVIPTGQNVGFAPWATVIDKNIPDLIIAKNHIVYIVEVDPGVKKKYNEIYGSKLITPDDKKLIL